MNSNRVVSVVRSALMSVALLAAASCRSGGGGEEIRSSAASNPAARVEQLQALGHDTRPLLLLARVRLDVDGSPRTFTTRLSIERQRLEADVLSPLGTEVARVEWRDGQVLLLDDIHRTWWRGSAAEASRWSGGVDLSALTALGSEAALLAGLVPDTPLQCVAAGEVQECTSNELRLRVATDGIISADGESWSMRFTRPGTPPGEVEFVSGQARLTLTPLELRRQVGSEPLQIPAGYRKLGSE